MQSFKTGTKPINYEINHDHNTFKSVKKNWQLHFWSDGNRQTILTKHFVLICIQKNCLNHIRQSPSNDKKTQWESIPGLPHLQVHMLSLWTSQSCPQNSYPKGFIRVVYLQDTAVNYFSIITTSKVTELSNLLMTSFRVVASHEGYCRFIHVDYPIADLSTLAKYFEYHLCCFSQNFATPLLCMQ